MQLPHVSVGSSSETPTSAPPRPRWLALVAAFAIGIALIATIASPASATEGTPGDETLTVSLNDSEAGGTYDVSFEKVFAGTTEDGTPVYIYVPTGALGDESVDWLNPRSTRTRTTTSRRAPRSSRQGNTPSRRSRSTRSGTSS
jgi:hypothetical protein